MKRFIYILLVIFLSGCICGKRKVEEIKKLPEVYLPEEEIKKEEIEKEVPEIKKIEIPSEEKIKEEEIAIVKKEVIPPLEKKEEKIIQKEKKVEEKKIIETKTYLEKWNGECLIYNLKWNLISFGRAIIICFEEKENYHLVGITLPSGLPANLGYGYNRVDAFIDKKTGKTRYFYLYTKSGRSEKITEIYFNWSGKYYTCLSKKFRDKRLYSTKRNTVKFDTDIYDCLSIFYFLRNENPENLNNIEMPVALPEKWYVKINFKGKEIKKLPSGLNKEVFIIEPIARSEKEKFKDGKLDVWITEDERIPVYFEGKVPQGKAVLVLNDKKKVEKGKYSDVNEFLEDIIK